MNLWKEQQEHNKRTVVYVPKEVVHNFSSYKLSKEEHEALSYSLDYHIPSNSLNTEFEMFLKKGLTKLRSTCQKYYQVKPYFKSIKWSRTFQKLKRLSSWSKPKVEE